MRICLIPLKTEARKPDINFERLTKRLEKAMKHGPDLVCFPECTLTGYLSDASDLERFAEKVPGPAMEKFGRLARENSIYICFGLLESTADGVCDTAVLLDRAGNIILKHHKINEKPPFSNGSKIDFADITLRRIGILICADLFDKRVIEKLDPSIDIILVPMFRSFDRRSPDEVRWSGQERVAYTDAAKATGRTVLLVNALECGEDEPSFGGAMVVNSQGCILAETRHGTDTELFWDYN